MAIDRLVRPKGTPLISMLFYGIALAWSFTTMAEEQEQLQEPFSLGVVDRQLIIRESLAGENVRNEFEAKEKAYRDEISARENGLRAQQEDLAGQRAILTPEAFAARESEFANKVEQLQRDVNERNKKLENMLAYGMQQIDMAAIQIIAEIAQDKKFTLVLDKTQLLMVAKSYEFSDLVITILNERLPVVSVIPPEELPQ
mgnify:FL=1